MQASHVSFCPCLVFSGCASINILCLVLSVFSSDPADADNETGTGNMPLPAVETAIAEHELQHSGGWRLVLSGCSYTDKRECCNAMKLRSGLVPCNNLRMRNGSLQTCTSGFSTAYALWNNLKNILPRGRRQLPAVLT